MIEFTRWHFTPSLSWAKKDDPTWWVVTDKGHKCHQLIGLTRCDVDGGGAVVGQEVHAVIGRLRIGLMMRFSKEALERP